MDGDIRIMAKEDWQGQTEGTDMGTAWVKGFRTGIGSSVRIGAANLALLRSEPVQYTVYDVANKRIFVSGLSRERARKRV